MKLKCKVVLELFDIIMFSVSIHTGDGCSVRSYDRTHSEVITTTGNSVQLLCGSLIYDSYTLEWTRYYTSSVKTILRRYSTSNRVHYDNGYSESDYTFNTTDSSLTVHNVTLMDAGCYKCTQTHYAKHVDDAVSITTSSSKC